MFNKVNHSSPSVTMYSNASDTSLGAYMENVSTGGPWSCEKQFSHINAKEWRLVWEWSKVTNTISLIYHMDQHIHKESGCYQNITLKNSLIILNFSPRIDLFTSRINCQIPLFTSCKLDPSSKFFYFPLFSCISKRLQEER